MYRLLFIVAFTFLATGGSGQALQVINYNYQYNPNETFSLQWRLVKEGEQFAAYFDLEINDQSPADYFQIQLEGRNSLSEKTSSPIDGNIEFKDKAGFKTGKILFSTPAPYVVLKVIRTDKNTAWLFFKSIQSAHAHVLIDSMAVLTNYVSINTSYNLFYPSQSELIGSYYKEDFPAGAPPFSTAQASVSKLIKPDSIFTLSSRNNLSFSKKGLYLIQSDTASREGFAFRAEADYPKFSTFSSLAGPLVYICTKQEYLRILNAGNDKKKFDQVILSITGNADRARNFMRSYFQRVELANRYFSSYKEGWKTDRGMLFIIFGLPDAVYLFDNREVWEYKNTTVKGSFTFVKSPTVFDPENYVLIREKKFDVMWYDTIDLWRKSRF